MQYPIPLGGRGEYKVSTVNIPEKFVPEGFAREKQLNVALKPLPLQSPRFMHPFAAPISLQTKADLLFQMETPSRLLYADHAEITIIYSYSQKKFFRNGIALLGKPAETVSKLRVDPTSWHYFAIISWRGGPMCLPKSGQTLGSAPTMMRGLRHLTRPDV